MITKKWLDKISWNKIASTLFIVIFLINIMYILFIAVNIDSQVPDEVWFWNIIEKQVIPQLEEKLF